MWFVAGLIVGSSLAGDPAARSMLQEIPVRCLYAFEVSEGEYRACRAHSMYLELNRDPYCRRITFSSVPEELRDRVCDLGSHIEWEMGALRELRAAVEASRQGDQDQ